MSASSNYLVSKGDGSVRLKDFQHAARLYVDDTYAKAPKLGFLYFVEFEINSNAVLDESWDRTNKKIVGLLVKKIDLPKFSITSEKLNQYNRKTVVQSKLNYNDISIDFHDDNSSITHNLWVNYFQHYYIDSRTPDSFADTKFGAINYRYGRYDSEVKNPFIDKIKIFVLHQQKFTQFTLINPKILEWQHDTVDQSEAGKPLKNRMTVAYENVVYSSGIINAANSEAKSFIELAYDKDPSPYQYGDLVGPTPIRNFGPKSPYVQGGPGNPPGPLEGIARILAQDYLNKRGLGRRNAVGYNIAGSILGAVTQPGGGKYSSPQPSQNQPGVFGSPGGIGVNIFKGFNKSVDGKIRANPAAIIFPKK